jgi:putative nucleotidyltransferase with HDIG domain
MKLPSVEECYQLFAEYHVPNNIMEHCKSVSTLAVRIAEGLVAKGVSVDVEVVRVLGLLHDWMKMVALENPGASEKFSYTLSDDEKVSWISLRKRFPNHHESEAAYELLKDDYPELAALIKKEGALSDDLTLDRGWEEKIVHYADWRVLGSEIVPLVDRLDDFFDRYNEKIVAGGLDRWEKAKELEIKCEEEICDALGVSVGEL